MSNTEENLYATLHSDRIESPNYYGVTFVAQLLSGCLYISAKLTVPLGLNKHDFPLDKAQWCTSPYMLDLGPVYQRIFDEADEVRTWIETTVIPWSDRQKLAYLTTRYEIECARLEQTQKEIDRLRALV